MNSSLIGVSINNNELCLAQLSGTTGKLVLCRMPESLMSEDKIADFEALSAFIRDQIKQNGLQGRKCALVLPGNATFFRTVNMPIASADQIKLNLPYEFRDYISSSRSEYVYDYELESAADEASDEAQTETLTLLAAAVQKNVVKENSDLLHGAGVKLKVALPREMALIRLIRTAKQRGVELKKEFSIIDIEGNHIHVSVFKGERLIAFKVIDSGFADIDTAISERYSVSVADAVAWRDENRNNILSSDSCEAVYDRISLEVLKTFNFYRYEHPQSEIGDVYFCGSGAKIKPLTASIIRYIDFTEDDIIKLLPAAFQEHPQAKDCAIVIGVTL